MPKTYIRFVDLCRKQKVEG